MITRIEIDGFKTFQDFAVDLAPFQVIIGANGCGKSNLLDAINLLSELANTSNLEYAPSGQREYNQSADIESLFTIFPNGNSAQSIKLAVEMLVYPYVHDDEDHVVKTAFTRLRYEIEIERYYNEKGRVKLRVKRELLLPINSAEDDWMNRYIAADERKIWQPSYGLVRTVPFLSFILDGDIAVTTFYADAISAECLHTSSVHVDELKQTAVASAKSFKNAHVMAVQNEMYNWQRLDVEASSIRMGSEEPEYPYVRDRGDNSVSAMARLYKENPSVQSGVSRDLTYFVPSIREVSIEQERQSPDFDYSAKVRMRDGRLLPFHVLSDGTLRLLVLAVIKHDPNHCLVLCAEEPENGLHPAVLKRLTGLLRDMTTNFGSDNPEEEWLRQVLATTHSPTLVSHLDIEKGELLYAEMVTRMQPGQLPMQVTRMTPVGREIEGDKAAKSYTLNQVFKYLNNADYQGIREDLQKAGG